jgi:arylsulfatase A
MIFLLGSLTPEPLAADKPVQPNVIFFLMDDMGYGDLIVYNQEAKLRLPNLESMAAKGIVFTDAHSPASVCAPTRYSVLTGNYPWRGRLEWGSWLFNRPSQVLPGQLTLGHLFEQAGYRNAFIGKLHMGGRVYDKETGEPIEDNHPDFTRIDWSRPLGQGPLEQGFHYSMVLPNGIQARPYAWFENDVLMSDPADLIFWEEGVYERSVIQQAGFGDKNWDSSEAGPRLTQAAIDFINQHKADNAAAGVDKPFFLYYASQSCHTPHTAPDHMMGIPIAGVSGIDAHLDLIYEADVTLGLLMETLRQHGTLENTLIVFSSDNGGLIWGEAKRQGHNSSGPLRGGKGSIFEGGHRVPLLVRWGDGTPEGSPIPPGRVSPAIVGLQDFFATFAEMTKQSFDANQGLDSFSIWQYLLGKPNAPVRQTLFVQSHDRGVVGQESTRLWRDGPWKLIVDRNHEAIHLFNLDEDLGETNDLFTHPDQQERIREMQAAVRQLRRSHRSTPLIAFGD